jgi:hypothetical protein
MRIPSVLAVAGFLALAACDGHDGTEGPPASPEQVTRAAQQACPPAGIARLRSPLSTATATSQRPTFRWFSPPSTVRSNVQICRDRACTDQEQVFSSTSDQGQTPVALKPGVHFWRVVSRIGSGRCQTQTTSLTWEVFIGHRSASIDTSWGSIADFNGDGLGDFAAQSDHSDTSGNVYVFAGSRTGVSATPATTISGDVEHFGFLFASAGDVNGDGFADLIIPFVDTETKVLVYLGGPSGLPTTASQTVTVNSTTNGVSVAGLGDINGDGYGDVAVGDASGQHVHIYLGSATGLQATPGQTLDGPDDSSSFGSRVAAAGDLDGDGFADLVVADVGFGTAVEFCNPGRAYVYLGSASGFTAQPQVVLDNPDGVANDFGVALGSSDVDGDGRSDLLVTTTCLFNGRGRVFIYRGQTGGVATSPDFTLASPDDPDAENFGFSVSTAGDLNGDGYGDIVVGQPRFVAGGSAFVYLGGPNGPSTTPSTVLRGFSTGEFGASVISAGDADGDGFSDLVVGDYLVGPGNRGQAYLFQGTASGLDSTPVLTIDNPDAGGGGFSFFSAGAF